MFVSSVQGTTILLYLPKSIYGIQPTRVYTNKLFCTCLCSSPQENCSQWMLPKPGVANVVYRP